MTSRETLPPRSGPATALQQERSFILAETAAGPIFSKPAPPTRQTDPITFSPLLSRWDRIGVGTLSTVWLLAMAIFWLWWLESDHVVQWAGFIINSLLFLYFSSLSAYFVIMTNRIRRISPDVELPALRTAFVVTKAPSEPWELAKETILAMLMQDFPSSYDVWLCDEKPMPDALEWCGRNAVNVSTREGVAAYHQPYWPRRTKCKEGNLAYFYDHWGYDRYDVVVQLDCDHVPSKTYLSEMVRPFADPAIGYVAAPSINDSNAAQSWVARGRVYCEAALHGPVQLGHSDGLAPACFGSHYAVRTQALRAAGGIGPELAEDFSTTLLITSTGWKSAFAHNAEAHGEGPRTFQAMATQEFQWSRSIMTLFMDTLPTHLGRLSWRLRIRFLFAFCYYPLLSVAFPVGLALPVVAAVTGVTWVSIDYFDFFARWVMVELAVIPLLLFVRSRKLLRPQDAPILSWEGCMYMIVRWPFVVWGVLTAVLQKMRPVPVVFRVTPKTSKDLEAIPVPYTLPFCVVSAALSTAAIVGEMTTRAYGFILLCIAGAVCYGAVALAVPLLHAAESSRMSGVSFRSAARETSAAPLVVGTCVGALAFAALILYPRFLLNVIAY